MLATTALSSTALLATSLSASAQSLPTGGSVAAGSVSIAQPSATQLNVTQASQSAVVNWQSFSVGQGATVNFLQPNASSAILNRVTSSAPSTIAGTINANGQVYLVNPNGIAITRSGVVNTGAFVASTLGISDADFMNGNRTFTGNGSSARVSNAGVINVGRGGYSALIGGTVSNSGAINVPLGKVGLGSGEKATLDFSGDGFLQVAMPTRSSGRGALIRNSGSITADGGSVVVSAATAREAARNAINISGLVQARSISGRSGAIVIGGGAGGGVKVTGRLIATARHRTGGSITVTGRTIRLSGATVNASGKTGGGIINIGGGRQGQGPLLRADATRIDKTTVIKADATQSGNGGNVVVWSDLVTNFAGTISARGGAKSGNGGEAEVSSHGVLSYTGLTTLLAAHGAAGTLLLDPYNITITGVDANGGFASGVFTPTGASTINTTTLQTQLALGNVTITTGGAGSAGADAGNITVAAPVTWSTGTTLTLTAANNIAVNAAITFGGATGAGLTLSAGNALTVASPIKVNGAGTVSLAYNASLPTNLSFGMTTAGTFTGGLTYNNADGSAATSAVAGQSLGINGVSYGLVYSMADVAGIYGALAGNYALATNIDASTAGTYTGAVVGNFSGTFQRLGHTLSNLTIDAPTTSGPGGVAVGATDVGLFRANSGTLRDFALAGGSVVAEVAGNMGANTQGLGDDFIAQGVQWAYLTTRTGSVVASNSGTIANVATSAAVSGVVAVGGLAAVNTGTILNSGASGAVTSNPDGPYWQAGYNAGGLVGLNYFGTISNSRATGAVSGVQRVGGLIGAQDGGYYSGTTTSSFATGAVTGSVAGGLIGVLSGGVLQSSYATGAVSGSYAGGLIGGIYSSDIAQVYVSAQTASTTVTTSYATGNVTGAAADDYIGGLIGWMRPNQLGNASTTLTGVYVTGDVSGHNYVGGLIGQMGVASLDNSALTGSSASGKVSGTEAVGGLVGNLQGASLTNASASGAVSGSFLVGGLVGVMQDAGVWNNTQATFDSRLTNVRASGAVTGPDGARYIGGLVGLTSQYRYHPNLQIQNASATGLVTVGENASAVGGLIGGNGGETSLYGGFGYRIASSYATGAVTAGNGATAVGGLIGLAVDYGTSGASIGESYATGTVTVGNNASKIGGLVGDDQMTGDYDHFVNASGLIRNSFASGAVNASGNAYLVGGLIGNVSSTEYQSVYATGSVTVGANSNGVGGFAGGFENTNIASNAGYLEYNGFSIGRVSAGAGSTNVDASVGLNFAETYYNRNNNNAFNSYYGDAYGRMPVGLFYNSDTAGLGSTLSQAATTRQFTDGTALSVINPWSDARLNFAGGRNGLYPYAGQIFTNGVQAISGTAYSAAGSSVAGAGVSLAGAGSFGQTSTGANGAYYIALPAGTLGANALASAGSLNAATLAAIGNTGLVTSANLYANTLSQVTGATTSSAAPTRAATVAAATIAAGTNAAALAALAGATGTGLISTGASFTINQAVTSSGSFVAATTAASAPLILSAAVSAATTLLLQASGDLTIASGGLVSGASPVLATTGAFINNAGSTAVTATSGHWQIYSSASAGDTFGGLDSGNTAIWNRVSGTAVSASGNRYVFATAPMLTVSTVNATKIYGDDGASLVADGYTITGLQAGVAGAYLGDTVTTATSGAATITSAGSAVTAGVGSYAYNLGQGTLAAAAGYGLTFVNSGMLSVTKRAISVTADAQSRIYGDANPTLSYVVGGSGLVNGDTLSGGLSTAATVTSNVGAYAITQGTLAASTNYAISYTAANLAIGQRAITVTADAQSRAYGNTNPALSYAVGGAGLVNGDTLSGGLTTLAGAASDVGAYAITQGNLGNGNYAIAYTGANLSITQRAITVTADAQSRAYGNANPTLTYTVGGGGLVNGDTLIGGLATSAGTASNVGSYAITQGTLGNGNYAIVYTGANLGITQRAITVTADAQSRVYGDANPALTYTIGGGGLVNGDTLLGGLSTAANATSNVGSYSIAQSTLSASSNYTVSYTGANLTVTQRAITVTADAHSRVYGDANPALTYTISGGCLVNNDTLSGGLSTAANVTSNVGNYAIAQNTLAASANYTLSYTGANLAVTQRSISVTADAQSRLYGNANPTLTYSIGGGRLVNGDTLLGGLATSAGTASNVGSYAITQGTLGNGNYTIAYTGANLSVMQRAITVAADAQSRVYGDANPTLTYTIGGGGLVNGDTLSGGLTTAGAASGVGSYAITQGTLGNGNYAIAYTGANLGITQRAITVTADAQSRAYGDANPALTYVVGGGGLVNGDTLSNGLSTAANATSNVGTYAITQGALAASSNYTLAYTGANLGITQRAITVTADAKSRFYGEANPTLTYTVGGGGLVNGDTLSGSLSTAANATSDVGNYAIAQNTVVASTNYTLSYTGANFAVRPHVTATTPDTIQGITDGASANIPRTFIEPVQTLFSALVAADDESAVTGGSASAAPSDPRFNNAVVCMAGVCRTVPTGSRSNP